jgi:hypothetical protein
LSGRTRKVESQLKEIVGEEVASLSDPRIKGLVTVTGVRVNEDTFSIQLRDFSQKFRMFHKDELQQVIYEKNSMMPAYPKLSQQELDDLLAYLVSLQGASKGSDVKQAEGIR